MCPSSSRPPRPTSPKSSLRTTHALRVRTTRAPYRRSAHRPSGANRSSRAYNKSPAITSTPSLCVPLTLVTEPAAHEHSPAPCHSHATATSRAARTSTPKSLPPAGVTRSPRPVPDPFLPANTPPPLRGKAKAREAARGASRSPNHSYPGPQDRPHRLAIPLQCPPRCAPRCAPRCPLPHPARTLLPPPSAFGARDSRARPFRPSPSLRARNAPCIASSLPAGASRAPRTPIRARHPSTGCLPPPPASRSSDPPPPASSYERPLTLSARATPTEHREKASRQRTE